MWFVYVLKCFDNTLYTGITTDTKRRELEHNTSLKAAKYTRIRRPVELVYAKEFKNRSEASKEEYRIKQLSRKQKDSLIQEK